MFKLLATDTMLHTARGGLESGAAALDSLCSEACNAASSLTRRGLGRTGARDGVSEFEEDLNLGREIELEISRRSSRRSDEAASNECSDSSEVASDAGADVDAEVVEVRADAADADDESTPAAKHPAEGRGRRRNAAAAAAHPASEGAPSPAGASSAANWAPYTPYRPAPTLPRPPHGAAVGGKQPGGGSPRATTSARWPVAVDEMLGRADDLLSWAGVQVNEASRPFSAALS